MKKILLFVMLIVAICLVVSVKDQTLQASSEPVAAVGTGNSGELSGNETLIDEKHPKLREGLINWFRGWLHVIDIQGEDSDQSISGLLVSIPDVPGDFARTTENIGGTDGFYGLGRNLFLVFVIFLAGFSLELLFRKLTAQLTVQLADFDHNSELGFSRIWAAMLHILPRLVHITIFAFASLGIFILTYTGQSHSVRALFMAILVAIVLARTIVLVSTFLCSPDIRGFRLLPLENLSANAIHRSITILAWYICFGLMFIALLDDFGADLTTLRFIGLLLGTVLIVLIMIIMLAKKKAVRASILGMEEGEEVSWLRRQFASSWHIIAMLYLFGIWLIWLNSVLTSTGKASGALLISLIIIPLYLLLENFAQWLVRTVVTTLNIFQPSGPKNKLISEDDQALNNTKEKEARFKKHMLRVLRLFIGVVLMIWLISLWGYNVPFAVNMVHIGFDILVTLTLAFFFWRITSDFIKKKLAESYKEEEEEEEIDDTGEFGAVKQRGRDYTILPLLRKFIATTLLVMVTLIILSSIGVNIGPLLAGAGVVGLAIGFGAQKLVSDVLSGVFYLLDDAFRVGEYIQAGSVTGSVEAITLRNVMLRHHRGMLQIVPHSDLGTITNFMRGGIVVKFNLEFPYDTDVNVVRKIIKKVGKQMLEDPEMGPDFIKPLKSQGVREIANSVMVIRAKFTAQPGKHFVIKREAFRLISESLAAKGIHYAHRKVIVEVPNLEEKKNIPTLDQAKQILEAGAAAGQIVMNDGKQVETGKKESLVDM
jgi:moderate conductance mechanosensitive channel